MLLTLHSMGSCTVIRVNFSPSVRSYFSSLTVKNTVNTTFTGKMNWGVLLAPAGKTGQIIFFFKLLGGGFLLLGFPGNIIKGPTW